jgi:hypothetical protein
MPGSPQRKPAKPEGQFQQSTDYNTGRRTVYHEIEVPHPAPGEPHAIRAQATETSPNEWMVKVHHGPHAERDASGSYYKDQGTFSHSGPLSSLKPTLKRTTGQQFKGLRT